MSTLYGQELLQKMIAVDNCVLKQPSQKHIGY